MWKATIKGLLAQMLAVVARGGGALGPLRLRRLWPAREVPCGVQLRGGEHVDGERRALQVPAGLGLPGQRHLAERRVEGDGREGVDSGPVRDAVRLGAGHDRDTGGEPAETIADVAGGERHVLLQMYAMRTG